MERYKRCPKCVKPGTYNEKYDSVFCKECNIWIEDTCTDHNCTICMSRPKKPENKENNEKI